jgi:diaminopimelate decarboxylase
LNLGGAWHGIADLPRTLAAVRGAIPAQIELVIEPGRALVEGAGFACGRVLLARDAGDRPLRVVELSRICHLRWSQVELVVERPGEGESTLFVGPTCFEDDVLGDWLTEPPAVGDMIALRNVSGYAVGWNTTFGGVAAAEILLI